MDKKELMVYNKVMKEKYKFYKLWKVLAIVFICLTILFATLYFCDGDIFRETVNNEVEIINDGGSNSNIVTINN